MLEQAVRPRLKMPEVPARKRRLPGPVRRPILAKPSATKQRKAAPGKPGTREVSAKLEQPAAKKQRKGACPKCEEAAKSGKSAPCPGCNVPPELERPPVPSMKGMASDAHHPAERQADAIGARIGASLASVPSFGPGPLPDHARAAAEPHLGVSLSGTQLRADRGAQRKAASESAWAVTEGRTVSFAAGQFSSSTSAGRALIGHELTHVGQQATYSSGLQRQVAGCVPAPQGFPLIYDRWGKPPRPAQPAAGYAQQRLNEFLLDYEARLALVAKTHPRAARFMQEQHARIRPPHSAAAIKNHWALDVDCKFGPNTTAATKVFQAAAFPTASPTSAPSGQSAWDGKIGPKTWPALVAGSTTAPPTPTSHKPPAGHGGGCTRPDPKLFSVKTQDGPAAIDYTYFSSFDRATSQVVTHALRPTFRWLVLVSVHGAGAYDVGFLQNVSKNHVTAVYASVNNTTGATCHVNIPTPIRDGAKNIVWYGKEPAHSRLGGPFLFPHTPLAGVLPGIVPMTISTTAATMTDDPGGYYCLYRNPGPKFGPCRSSGAFRLAHVAELQVLDTWLAVRESRASKSFSEGCFTYLKHARWMKNYSLTISIVGGQLGFNEGRPPHVSLLTVEDGKGSTTPTLGQDTANTKQSHSCTR